MAMLLTGLIVGGALRQKSLPRMSSGIRMAFTFVTINHCLAFWSGTRRFHYEDLLVRLEGVARILEPYARNHAVRLRLRPRKCCENLSAWLCQALRFANRAPSTGGADPHLMQVALENVHRYSARAIWVCKFYALLDCFSLIIPLCLSQVTDLALPLPLRMRQEGGWPH